MSLSNDQKQDLRHAILEGLVNRHPAALSPRQIQRAVKKEVDFLFEESDVLASLELLKGMAPALVNSTEDPLGGGHYWAATSAGVLHVERNHA